MIKIIKSGLLDTLQDEGRIGFADIGINPSGAMDYFAMQVANILVGNHPKNAVIEMHFPAPIIQFTEPTFIALSGANFNAHINETPIPLNKTIAISAHSILSFKNKKFGNCCYLAVAGGYAVNPYLHSVSTNIIAEIGGLNGKKLSKGDALFFNQKSSSKISETKIFPWQANVISAYSNSQYFYFIKGPEWEYFNTKSQHIFLQEPFTISTKSDRMAIRLMGQKLVQKTNEELVSSAVTKGTMQLLPNGEILILMADHQTTGGYPRIGNIIKSHLPKLAQTPAGHPIHFLFVNEKTAEELLIAQQEDLDILQAACKMKLTRLHE